MWISLFLCITSGRSFQTCNKILVTSFRAPSPTYQMTCKEIQLTLSSTLRICTSTKWKGLVLAASRQILYAGNLDSRMRQLLNRSKTEMKRLKMTPWRQYRIMIKQWLALPNTSMLFTSSGDTYVRSRIIWMMRTFTREFPKLSVSINMRRLIKILTRCASPSAAWNTKNKRKQERKYTKSRER